MKSVVRMEEWELVVIGEEVRLSGKVYEHPKIKDGALVLTSSVIYHHKEAELVETKNSFYELGTPKEV